MPPFANVWHVHPTTEPRSLSGRAGGRFRSDIYPPEAPTPFFRQTAATLRRGMSRGTTMNGYSKLVACGVLALGTAAFAGGDKNKQELEAQGGSGAAGMEVEVDQAVMKKMKMQTQQAMKQHKAWIDKNMQDWPQKTKEVAAVTIGQYGPPQGVSKDLLVWGESGPWKQILLHREIVRHNFPMPHEDVLQQFVNFEVPADKFDELAQYDGSVVAERTTGNLSARCDKEEANFLAINLAADVAEGRKSVEEARDYYANAIKGMLQGKMDPYMKGLRIDTKGKKAGDMDQARFANPMTQGKAMGRKAPGNR
jgi:hypothetical protein